MIRKQVLFWLLLPAQLVMAQGPVSLNDCQQWAREQHPLLKQEELYRQMSEMKLKNLENNHLPQINLNAQATYQSDVTQIGISMPGIDFPGVSKDQYKAYLDVRQNIWDGGITKANEMLEKAQDEANRQGVEVELYQVKEQVNSLFFTSFFIQQNLDILAKKQETIETRRKQVESGVTHGVVLASDLDLLLAELIKLKQQQTELQSGRETVLAALAILTGKQPADLDQLVIESPDLIQGNDLNRPELDFFDMQTELLSASSDLLQKKRNPKLFGFGQAGYGRPGLNMLNDDFDTYYLVGVGLNWTVFDWKNTKREQEVVRLQQEMVQTQQQQFERNINIALDGESRKIRQLQDMQESDRELIAVQERITQSSAAKLENGAITMADYLQDLNAEVAARITLETRKIQLEAVKINYQTIQGK
ncbi:TolC family protein [Gaoshiqia sediminis]|uniref:TolC family protein n=1 Tax=Gaoshiqia sediminis TaxID=2986998 RepID=A0AA41Y3Q7_9BACT|nr:TolC family protein [Gaoshiqia sediminis]MCW0481275.1 TolC family protein [Gaoshiqia sediminis]